MKRKNEEMQGELSNLRQLYDFLRLGPEHEALDVFRRIRAHPVDALPSQSIQELAKFVRHGRPHDQQPPYPPPSPYQHDVRPSVTLPPIRVALDSPGSLGPHTSPFSATLPMSLDGPTSQRRRHGSDVDVAAR
jgi:hypothetical protein